MEVCGVVLRPIPCYSGAGIDAHSHHSSLKFFPARVSVSAGDRFSGKIRQLCCRELRVSVKPRNINGQLGSGFCDMGHVQYYSASRPTVRCGGGKKEKQKEKEMKMKKKVKLLKGLSKNLSNLPEIGFGLDPDHDLADQVKGKIISDAAELLLKELQQLRAKEKELKRKRKEEKAKLKATPMQNKINCEESSDSSSESSDSECGEVVDMSHLKIKVPSNPTTFELQPPLIQESTLTPSTPPSQPPLTQQERLTPTSTPVQGGSGSCSGSCTHLNNAGNLNSSSVPNGASTRKIEVCMGGKCKKLGAASLLENFERVVGSEGLVVGCKCMGKCRDGPNVRVLNHVDGVEADEYVRKPYNPLCIGVGLEDVSSIVANFFGGNQKDLGLATAS